MRRVVSLGNSSFFLSVNIRLSVAAPRSFPLDIRAAVDVLTQSYSNSWTLAGPPKNIALIVYGVPSDWYFSAHRDGKRFEVSDCKMGFIRMEIWLLLLIQHISYLYQCLVQRNVAFIWVTLSLWALYYYMTCEGTGVQTTCSSNINVSNMMYLIT